MAKVTRTKYNAKKFEKALGADRPFMETPKVVHSLEKRMQFNAWERQLTPNYLKYSFNC